MGGGGRAVPGDLQQVTPADGLHSHAAVAALPRPIAQQVCALCLTQAGNPRGVTLNCAGRQGQRIPERQFGAGFHAASQLSGAGAAARVWSSDHRISASPGSVRTSTALARIPIRAQRRFAAWPLGRSASRFAGRSPSRSNSRVERWISANNKASDSAIRLTSSLTARAATPAPTRHRRASLASATLCRCPPLRRLASC